MTSRLMRFGIACIFLISAALLPVAASAQAPTFITAWGTFGTGNGQFSHPYGIAVGAAGNGYVVDSGNSRVQELTSSGAYVTKWGTPGSGNGQFVNPYGVAVDATTGNVYVVDSGNSRIQVFTSSGAYLTQWGTYGSGNGQFSGPVGVAVDADGDVYVTDQNNNRIQKFGPVPTPTKTSTWGQIKTLYR